MNVIFMGGRQAGCLGLLTLCSVGLRPIRVIYYDDMVFNLGLDLGFNYADTITAIKDLPDRLDLLVSVHGREIVRPHQLAMFKDAINVHPCLWKYPGADPVRRLIRDYGTKASVGCHRMTAEVDGGEVLAEEFIELKSANFIDEVYNQLYSLYPRVLLAALRKLGYVA